MPWPSPNELAQILISPAHLLARLEFKVCPLVKWMRLFDKSLFSIPWCTVAAAIPNSGASGFWQHPLDNI